MAQLFGVEVNTINYHLKEIYSTKELTEEATIRKIRIVQKEGNRSVERERAFYSLDAIISVGYRVNSIRATKFRQWATLVLKEYITKGFALEDERLKQGTAVFGKDYFRELLERVRSIRASERRIWQQITDIYAECSTDYDKSSPTTRDFYAMTQNRFHYAITGMTAAEIIYTQADHTKDHMGLTTWKLAPDGRVLKSDVSIAKIMSATAKPQEIERFTLSKGQVALTKDSEIRDDIGIATYIADNMDNVVLGYHCAVITPNSALVDSKYLNAYMHSNIVHKYFENNASGSGQRYTLSYDSLLNIPVLLPDLELQKEIGQIFSNIDRKIALNRQINDNLYANAC